MYLSSARKTRLSNWSLPSLVVGSFLVQCWSVHGFGILPPPSLSFYPTTTGSSAPNALSRLFLEESTSSSSIGSDITLESLIDMDVVIYSQTNDESATKLLGAVQEDGSLAPLSAWTNEPAFGQSIELLVDEEDRFSLDAKNIQLHYLLQESELSYGSRQCHRGLGNPHGEESELLYYVEQSVLDKFEIQVPIKPHLEILW